MGCWVARPSLCCCSCSYSGSQGSCTLFPLPMLTLSAGGIDSRVLCSRRKWVHIFEFAEYSVLGFGRGGGRVLCGQPENDATLQSKIAENHNSIMHAVLTQSQCAGSLMAVKNRCMDCNQRV